MKNELLTEKRGLKSNVIAFVVFALSLSVGASYFLGNTGKTLPKMADPFVQPRAEVPQQIQKQDLVAAPRVKNAEHELNTENAQLCFAWGPLPKAKVDSMVNALFSDGEGSMGNFTSRKPSKPGFFLQFDKTSNPNSVMADIKTMGGTDAIFSEINGIKGIYLVSTQKTFSAIDAKEAYKGKIFAVPTGGVGEFIFFQSSNEKVVELGKFAQRNNYPQPGTVPCQ